MDMKSTNEDKMVKHFLVAKDTISDVFDANDLDEAEAIAIKQSEQMNKVYYLYGCQMVGGKQFDCTLGCTYRKGGDWKFEYVRYNEPVRTIQEMLKKY